MKSGFQLGREARNRCSMVLADYSNGVTSIEESVRRLRGIEEAMYSENPNAEPDGDITYAVATAHEKLLNEKGSQ